MIKLILYFLLISFVIFFSCKGEKIENVPDCIAESIGQFRTISCDFGAKVSEYSFRDTIVYVFYPGDCSDGISSVYNAECSYFGYIGGISGNMIIHGVNFKDNATFIRDIYKR